MNTILILLIDLLLLEFLVKSNKLILRNLICTFPIKNDVIRYWSILVTPFSLIIMQILSLCFNLSKGENFSKVISLFLFMNNLVLATLENNFPRAGRVPLFTALLTIKMDILC